MLRDDGSPDGDACGNECYSDPLVVAEPLHPCPDPRPDEPAFDETEALLPFSPRPPLPLLKYPLQLFCSLYPFLDPLSQ